MHICFLEILNVLVNHTQVSPFSPYLVIYKTVYDEDHEAY